MGGGGGGGALVWFPRRAGLWGWVPNPSRADAPPGPPGPHGAHGPAMATAVPPALTRALLRRLIRQSAAFDKEPFLKALLVAPDRGFPFAVDDSTEGRRANDRTAGLWKAVRHFLQDREYYIPASSLREFVIKAFRSTARLEEGASEAATATKGRGKNKARAAGNDAEDASAWAYIPDERPGKEPFELLDPSLRVDVAFAAMRLLSGARAAALEAGMLDDGETSSADERGHQRGSLPPLQLVRVLSDADIKVGDVLLAHPMLVDPTWGPAWGHGFNVAPSPAQAEHERQVQHDALRFMAGEDVLNEDGYGQVLDRLRAIDDDDEDDDEEEDYEEEDYEEEEEDDDDEEDEEEEKGMSLEEELRLYHPRLRSGFLAGFPFPPLFPIPKLLPNLAQCSGIGPTTFFRSVLVILNHTEGASTTALVLNYRGVGGKRAKTLAQWQRWRRGSGNGRSALDRRTARRPPRADADDPDDPEAALDVFADARINQGGPITKMVLHYLTQHKLAAGRELGDGSGVYEGGDLIEGAKLVNASKARVDDFAFYHSTAEWKPGQLLAEVEKGTWYVARGGNALKRLVFGSGALSAGGRGSDKFSPSKEGQSLWREAIKAVEVEKPPARRNKSAKGALPKSARAEYAQMAGRDGPVALGGLRPIVRFLEEYGMYQ